uniref:Kinesin-like protein n=1 Tax=Panagrolaimus davidi TaxID=227884 RepID=A0A914QV73_9BILA
MDASSKKVSIKTAARVRPCSHGTNLQSSLTIDSENSTIIVKSKNKEYRLNNVFDEDVTQETIYDTVAQPIVYDFLGGINGTIFAYGQTGSGKTFTMNGYKITETSDSPTRGIIPRSIESIFEILNEQSKNDPQFKFSIKCSYIEVYKKVAFDLLQTDSATVKIQASGEQIIIVGAAEFVVTSAKECLSHFKNGWNNRKTAPTSMNRESSRSHAIFMLTLVTEEIQGISVNLRTSRLNFVDLAGSENQKQTKSTGERLKEAGSINQDLSHLATVIRDLEKKDSFIQYRNCFLTHLLRDSLGGNSRTSVIVTVHSNLKFVNDTLSTLNFAENCKKVKNKAKVNVAVSTKDVEAWKTEIQRVQKDKSSLMEEIQQLKEEKEQMEKRQKEDAGTILILQNEKKTLKVEAAKHVQEVNEEKQNLQTQISFLEKNVAEQKEQINALEKSQKEAFEFQLAQMKKEYDLKIKKLSNDLNKANEKEKKREAEIAEMKQINSGLQNDNKQLKEKVQALQIINDQMKNQRDADDNYEQPDICSDNGDLDYVDENEVPIIPTDESVSSGEESDSKENEVPMQASPGSTSHQSNIIRAPNYRLGSEYYRSKWIKHLYIFDFNDKTLCYNYVIPPKNEKSKKAHFICINCKNKHKTNVCATIVSNENGEECVKLDTKKHVCQRQKFEPQTIIYEPDYKLITVECGGKKVERLYVLDSNDKTFYYDYIWNQSAQSYRCSNCVKKKHYSSAHLTKDESKKECCVLSAQKHHHDCKPKKL